MPDPNLEVLRKETYLKAIENAPGTRLFASLLARRKDTGAVEDVFRDGEYSCAAFVSSVLTLATLLDRPRATVAALRTALSGQGWREADGPPEPGDVLFWEDVVEADGTRHQHAGFAIGDGEAVSTSTKEKRVVRHHLTFGMKEDGSPVRRVIASFRHPFTPASKLVRDKIPAMIAAKGETATSHVAGAPVYRTLLRAKLREEVAELLAAENVEELADVREVLDAYAALLGIAPEEAARVQAEKREERGGFGGRIVLDRW